MLAVDKEHFVRKYMKCVKYANLSEGKKMQKLFNVIGYVERRSYQYLISCAPLVFNFMQCRRLIIY